MSSLGRASLWQSARGHDITIETQSSIPAGWYQDPAGTTGKRWWDGVQWTTHMQAPAPSPQAPIPVEPQRVDPYAQANPYGLPPVEQRSFVPMQNASPPPVPMQAVHRAHNRAAVGSAVVGAIASCLSLVGFIPGSPIVYYSASGVIAIVGGVRALVRRRAGFGTNAWAPVLAIALGALAVVFMVSGLIIRDTRTIYIPESTSLSQNDTGLGNGGAASTVPLPPSFAADPNLTAYERSAATIAQSIYVNYNGGQLSSSTPTWPADVTVASDGQVTFPTGVVATTIPAGEVLHYQVSPTLGFFMISVTGGDLSEVAVYDSKENTFSWACASAAAATCPPGGITVQPGSGDSSTGSNA